TRDRSDDRALAKTESLECLVRGAGDARTGDVADDRNGELADVPLVLADGHRVEQALRPMGGVSLARGDDGRLAIDLARYALLHAGLAVTDDEDIRLHREKRGQSVGAAL